MSIGIAKSPLDYLALFKRRKLTLAVVAAVVFPVTVFVAFYIPPIYRSSAMILIEEPEVPPELVQSTVTSYADQRIQLIKYRVMTSQNLGELMDRFGLYTELREDTPMTEIVERFREDIKVETIDAQVLDPRNGRPTRATIAFTLSYENKNPRKAQQVANELVTLYLAENTRERQGQAAAATEFLEQEAERLAGRIREFETKLAAFKQEHAGRLPHQLEANLEALDRSQRALADVERRINGLREQQMFLKSELDMVGAQIVASAGSVAQTGVTPAQRLIQMQNEAATLAETHGPNHPQLVRLKNEIAALERSVTALTALQEEDPPALTKPVQLTGFADLGVPGASLVNVDTAGAPLATATRESPPALVSLNPLYVQLRSQLKAAEMEIALLESEHGALVAQVAEYERRIRATPEIEREYRILVRDYDNAQRKYSETKDKQLAAELSQSLEVERKSERFVLIEPPQLPTEQVGLQKRFMVGLGFVFAVASSFGVVLLADAFDSRVHSARQLAALTGEAPLVVVPYIQTPAERRGRVAMRFLFVLAVLAGIAACLAAFHFLVMPLDILWFRHVAIHWDAALGLLRA